MAAASIDDPASGADVESAAGGHGTVLRRHPYSVVALVLSLGFLFGTVGSGAAGDTFGVDFGVFHAGGSLIATDGYDAAYDTERFTDYFTGAYFPSLAESDTVSHFISTPPFGFFAQGLSWADFTASFAVWLAAGVAALVAAVRVLQLPWWFAAVMAVSPMMAMNTSLGQTGAFVLLLFSAMHRAHVDGRVVRAGLLGGLLVLKPPLALGYGFLWVVQRRRYASAIAGAAATGLLLSIPTLLSGIGPWRAFLESMEHRADAESGWSQQSFSIPEFIKLATPNAPALVTLAAWGIGAAAALMLVIVMHRRHEDDAELLSATAVIAGVLASPHLLVYDSTIVLIAVAVAWHRGVLRRDDRVGKLALCLSTATALGPVLYEPQFALFRRGLGMELPMLAVFAWLLYRWLGERRPADESHPVLANS